MRLPNRVPNLLHDPDGYSCRLAARLTSQDAQIPPSYSFAENNKRKNLSYASKDVDTFIIRIM